MNQDQLNKLKKALGEQASQTELQEFLQDIEDLLSKPYQLYWPNKYTAHKSVFLPTTNKLDPTFSDKEHTYIVGDNLHAMQVLNQSHKNAFKCIYLDPPYNTGKAFVYNDKKHGNGLENSRVSWLKMIYPRLILCRELLQENGVLFVSIDDHAQPLIRNICDEIFGAHHFICTFVWRRSGAGGLRGKFPVPTHEYILCYTKDIHAHKEAWFAPYSQESLSDFKHKDHLGAYKRQALYLSTLRPSSSQNYPIELPDGTLATPPSNRGAWRYIESKYQQELNKGNIEFIRSQKSPLFLSNGQSASYNIYTKQYMNPQGSNPSTLLPESLGQTRSARAELKKLMGADVFDYAKPVKLIQYLFSLFPSKPLDLFLDPFSGSGTSAHALLKLNQDGIQRRFVMIQQEEPCPKNSNAFRVGYRSISELGQARIKRSIQEMNLDVEFKTIRLKSH
ncbi:MAG: hypothetical protein CMK59_07400 [Proteobacteria bacterium]|nr:hypothetical protein [Pseudomonadota bacterium]